MSATTAEFYDSLPRGPLVRHIEQIHALVNHIEACGKAGISTVQAHSIVEQSLREIAVYTQERNPYPRPQPQGAVPDIATTMRKAFADFDASLKKMRAGRTPEQRERVAVRRHQQCIKDERTIGLGFVKAYAAKTRKELGL